MRGEYDRDWWFATCPDCHALMQLTHPAAGDHLARCSGCGVRHLLRVEPRPSAPFRDRLQEKDLERAQLIAYHIDRQQINSTVCGYRMLLEENDIPIPDDGSNMEYYRRSREVIQKAGELMVAVLNLKDLYGSSMELLSDKSWR